MRPLWVLRHPRTTAAVLPTSNAALSRTAGAPESHDHPNEGKITCQRAMTPCEHQ